MKFLRLPDRAVNLDYVIEIRRAHDPEKSKIKILEGKDIRLLDIDYPYSLLADQLTVGDVFTPPAGMFFIIDYDEHTKKVYEEPVLAMRWNSLRPTILTPAGECTDDDERGLLDKINKLVYSGSGDTQTYDSWLADKAKTSLEKSED